MLVLTGRGIGLRLSGSALPAGSSCGHEIVSEMRIDVVAAEEIRSVNFLGDCFPDSDCFIPKIRT